MRLSRSQNKTFGLLRLTFTFLYLSHTPVPHVMACCVIWYVFECALWCDHGPHDDDYDTTRPYHFYYFHRHHKTHMSIVNPFRIAICNVPSLNFSQLLFLIGTKWNRCLVLFRSQRHRLAKNSIERQIHSRSYSIQREYDMMMMTIWQHNNLSTLKHIWIFIYQTNLFWFRHCIKMSLCFWCGSQPRFLFSQGFYLSFMQIWNPNCICIPKCYVGHEMFK